MDLRPVIPEINLKQSVKEFLASCQQYDSYFTELVEQAKSKGEVLRYVARLSPDAKASVGIESLPLEHGFANLNPADNIVQFTTQRYQANPLFVRGPGAGLDVTAAGLYGDMIQLALK